MCAECMVTEYLSRLHTVQHIMHGPSIRVQVQLLHLGLDQPIQVESVRAKATGLPMHALIEQLNWLGYACMVQIN